MEVGTFICSICGDVSQMICVYCTKDACGNHLCDRCHRCSDCCACELTFRDDRVAAPAALRNGHVGVAAAEEKRGDENSGTVEG
jgi:hypothetical protein